MKRTLSQLIVFVCLVAVFAGWRAYNDFVSNGLRQKLTQAANQANWRLEVKDIELSFPIDVQMRDFSVLFPTPQFPLPILIDQIEVNPRVIPFLWLQAHAPGNAWLYDGEIEFDVRNELMGGALHVSLDGSKIQLERHPLLRGFGVQGELSLQAKAEGNASKQPPISDGSWQLSVRNGSYRGGYRVKGLVEIPAVSEISASAQGRIENQKLIIRQASAQSSIGSASAHGELSLRPGPPIGSFNFKIRLHEQGAAIFNGYLALAANQPLDTPIRSWHLEVQMNGRGMPIVRAEPNE